MVIRGRIAHAGQDGAPRRRQPVGPGHRIPVGIEQLIADSVAVLVRAADAVGAVCPSGGAAALGEAAAENTSCPCRSKSVCRLVRGAAILGGMPDEPEVTPTVSIGGQSRLTAGGVIPRSATLRGEGTTVAGGTVRDAVQELRDSSLEELRRLLDLYIRDPANVAAVETLAAQAETTGMPSLAKLIRAGAKFGIMTIIAAIIGGPVNNEESNLMHWTPPSITKVQQMSPAQMDELSRQIERHMEQMARRQEAEHEHHRHQGHGHR